MYLQFLRLFLKPTSLKEITRRKLSVFTLCRIALTPARKPYRIWLTVDGDFGVISFKPGLLSGTNIPDDRGFYCFPTVPDFADWWKLEIVDIPDRLGWTETNLENRERFYFPNASQIMRWCAIIPDKWKLKFVPKGDVGDGFRSLPIS